MGTEELERAGITRRRLVERGVLLGGALTLPGILSACGGGDGSSPGAEGAPVSGKPRRGGRLRTGHVGGGNVESLNPLILPNIIDVARAQQLYDLLFIPDRDLKVQPRLAESVEPNRDATVWRLKLRAGVTFHDGKPFGADDVLYTWQTILDPKSKAEGRSTLEPLDLRATKRVSDSEIEVHLKRPIGDLPRLLSQRQLYVIPDGMKDFAKPNGTGPFRFVKWTQGERSLFRRFDGYWGDGGPYVDEVEMISIPDANARSNALLGGQVDAIEQLDFNLAKQFESNDAVQIVQTNSPSAPAMTMRMDVPPFDDPRVRQAFRLAADREKLVANALLGYGSIGNDLLGKGFPSYDDQLPQREYDPEQAKSLLSAAGHDGIKVSIGTARGVIPGLFESATAFAEQAKPAGIQVQLDQLQPDSYFNPNDRYLSKRAAFYQTFWPISFEQHATDALLADAPFRGETEWSKPGWDKAFRKAQGIADEDRRNAVYSDLQKGLYDDGGYLVWGFSDLVDAASSKVKDITPNPSFALGYFEYKDWWLEA